MRQATTHSEGDQNGSYASQLVWRSGEQCLSLLLLMVATGSGMPLKSQRATCETKSMDEKEA